MGRATKKPEPRKYIEISGIGEAMYQETGFAGQEVYRSKEPVKRADGKSYYVDIIYREDGYVDVVKVYLCTSDAYPETEKLNYLPREVWIALPSTPEDEAKASRLAERMAERMAVAPV